MAVQEGQVERMAGKSSVGRLARVWKLRISRPGRAAELPDGSVRGPGGIFKLGDVRRLWPLRALLDEEVYRHTFFKILEAEASDT